MEEDLVSFKTAVLANSKGFDILNRGVVYLKNGSVHRLRDIDFLPSEKKVVDNIACQAPSQSLLQKWLREEYSIYVRVDSVTVTDHYGWIKIFPNYIKTTTFAKTYEEALEIVLQEALNLI